MNAPTLRTCRNTDGAAISRLFREVYGDQYAHAQVYLPGMIRQNHSDGRWHSLVAACGEDIVGHAALFRNPQSRTAELALVVVHPSTRGQNVATQLGQKLLIHAQALGCRGVTIKQVTYHPYTQRMAERLGFHSTGILPDHVPSPFGQPWPESIVTGFMSIDGYQRPLPALDWPASCAEFMTHLCAVFGTRKKPTPWVGPPLQLEQHSGRYDVVLKQLNHRLIRQLQELPGHWLISIRLRLAEGFACAQQRLSRAGFVFSGIVPDDRSEGWLALFHRGHIPRLLQLHCSHMQALQAQAQAQAQHRERRARDAEQAG